MNVFELSSKITLDSSGYSSALSQAGASFSEFGSKIKAGIGAVTKATTAAVGAGAAAVGKIVKDAVGAYGEYEQLVGGIETLFEDLDADIIENANNAYRTAGMSANEYMQTVIGFGAALNNSLLQSEGNISRAAKLSDQIITDMSDNVNKMGTSMESIQNAYRGFSRGNFTMLDNLSLGFAGTKDGMQQLLDKAHELSGVEYNIESFADIAEAIHVVQTEMGITGTTAREAASTIQGSMGMMKSAWENLKVELTKDDGDIGKSLDLLIESSMTVFDNLAPRVERALGGVTEFVQKAAPVMMQKLPPMMNKIIPSLITASSSLMSAIGQGLFQAIPAALDSGIGIMAQLNSALRSGGSDTSSFLQDVFNDITARIPTIFRFGRRILDAIAEDLLNVDYGALAENLSKVFHSALSNMTSFVQGLDAEKIATNISDFINGLDWKKILTDLGKLLGDTVKKLPEFLKSFIENLDFDNASLMIATLFTPKILKSLTSKLGEAGAFDGVNGKIRDKIGEGAEPSASNFFSKFSLALDAFALGWDIGTFIRNLFGPEKIDKGIEAVGEYLRLVFTGTNNEEMLKEAAVEAARRDLGGVAAQAVRNAFESTGHDARGRYASGGVIIKKPTYDRFGNLFGEAGNEAILPLETNTGWMDRLADKIGSRSGVVVQNLNLSIEGGRIADDYDTERLVEKIAEKLGALNIRQERAVGGIGWT